MIVGITGGIGSGKSTLVRALAARGYAVYVCDDEAKRIATVNPDVRAKISALLGAEVYAEDIYQTAVVVGKLAADPSLLGRLSGIIHPAVKADIMQRNESPLFVESAILFECGFDAICDCTVAVAAPEQVRIARVLSREENWTEQDVRRRMRRQLPQAEVCERADIVLDNSGTQTIDALAGALLARLNCK